jgi:hypothetical protein
VERNREGMEGGPRAVGMRLAERDVKGGAVLSLPLLKSPQLMPSQGLAPKACTPMWRLWATPSPDEMQGQDAGAGVSDPPASCRGIFGGGVFPGFWAVALAFQLARDICGLRM